MSERIHGLAQQLFGKSSIEECDLQEIQHLVDRYPYFAAAQFLLLEKLKQEASPDYTSQLQKAVLYYHNPLEFEFFISSGQLYSDVEPLSTDEALAQALPQIWQENTPSLNNDNSDQNSIPAMEEVAENDSDPYWAVTKETINDKEEPLLHQEKIPLNLLEMKLLQIEQQESSAETLRNVSPLDPTLVMPEENVAELTFEPFHTVDYFASQGIKLSQDEAGKDKLGKQLKSFTDWLKTMKRLPVVDEKKLVETSTEKKVQVLAEDSVHGSDVYTEVMAEVWLKQGNPQKAIEIYHKLSLLNPSRMAYFAAKIDHLKSS